MVELVEHLYLLLPSRIGSSLSLNALREEIGVSFNTIASWVSILERLYICYRLSPFHRSLNRSLKKEQKLYFWDWSQVEEDVARFENMVAGHLLKAVHAWNDIGYGEFDLYYWRNKEQKEVDFVLTNKRRPIALFECKLSETSPAESLVQLSKMLGEIPAIQFTKKPDVDSRFGNSRVVTASAYLAQLV